MCKWILSSCARQNAQPLNLHPELPTTLENKNFQRCQQNRWWRAKITLENLNNFLNSLKLYIVDKSNIDKECICKNGLHLIGRGSGKLAINFVDKIRNLWLLTNSFHPSHLLSSVTVIPNNADTFDAEQSLGEYQNLGDSPDNSLHYLNLKNVNRIAIGHLNIISLRNKLNTLKLLFKIIQMSLWYPKQS